MKVKAQIKTQDDIKVNFFVEMTVGEMKDFISDVNINKLSWTSLRSCFRNEVDNS